ncbi:MAG TPA: hybrid sensor histidine kinase/response regulator, partial [Candidatus Obscuribacterales bacterium]
MTPPNPLLILIVDDDAQNLKLLNAALSEAGYGVAVANGGAVCFKVLEKRHPDLILCDVIMPEIDGYEVCRRLKASPEHRDTPLIFLTSRTDTEDLLRGFEVGAVDYVTKPFNKAELLARVRTHTELKQARDTILENSRQLESLNQRLKTLDAEKNHFLGIVAHDLKNPLTTIMMSAEMVEDRADKVSEEQLVDYMQMIQRNASRIRTIIMNLLDVNRIESGKLAVDLKPFDLRDFIARLLDQYRDKAERKQIRMHLEAPQE